MINIHEVSDQVSGEAQGRFRCNAADILMESGVPESPSNAIARALNGLMTTSWLYYHTISHINDIFAFVQNAGLKLSTCDKLAILFHDAVYVVGSKENERRSADLLGALLYPHGVEDTRIQSAQRCIDATAMHLKDLDRSMDFAYTVLDLDLVGLAAKREDFLFNNMLIDKEIQAFCDYKGVPYPMDKRYEFMKKLSERRQLFYNFKELEEQARSNIAFELDRIQKAMG